MTVSETLVPFSNLGRTYGRTMVCAVSDVIGASRNDTYFEPSRGPASLCGQHPRKLFCSFLSNKKQLLTT